jgi:hypothetical protein
MTTLEDAFLRGRAAQETAMQLATYNAALLGHASIQAMQLGLTAPLRFWGAVARASAAPAPAPVPVEAEAPKPRRRPRA